MSLFDDIINYLQDQIIFGNSLLDYVIGLIIFTGVLLTIEIFRYIIQSKLSQAERLQKKRGLKIIITTLNKYLSFSLSLILSIFVVSQFLYFSTAVNSIIRVLTYAFIAILFLKLCLNLLDAALEYQKSQQEKDIHILEFFRVILRGVLIVLVTLWFLTNLGVDVTAFAASLGILSLAIAFSLKEILSDIFASIVIFIDRPFEIGDNIKIDSDAGTVEKIGVRTTKIRSADGFLIVASNRELTSKKIHNLRRMEKRRVTMQIQIHQATPKSLLDSISTVVKGLISDDENLIFDKINLNQISDYSYDYELIYFVKTRDFKTHVKSKHNFLIRLLERFNELDVFLPYPTKTVIIEE